ncbi:MAG TPA: transketolase [Clostridiales bacterium]|nr:transketolase [Clostridiales bacterium]
MGTKQEQIRDGIKMAVCASGGGHAGGSLSIADILASLYGHVMKHNPQVPDWKDRDRLILSKGHSGLALYSALAVSGYFPIEELKKFGSAGARLMNHPDSHTTPGVEMSTGSLGHGLPLAVGIAFAGQLKKQDYFTYCILGDGECCEGSVWEAAMAADAQQLKRLVVVVDRNGIGNDGHLENIVQIEPLADKWRSFGFAVEEVNGHDVQAMNALFMHQREEAQGPYAVIAHTVKGKGLIETIAGTGSSHYLSGTQDSLKQKFDF